jgi:LL-diaminopimelate aminotransferase
MTMRSKARHQHVTMRAAKRLDNLLSYPFASLGQQIMQLRKQGVDVIRLDIGSPDLPPAQHILEALYRSAANLTHHSYSDYHGIPALRQAMADYYTNRFGVTLDPNEEILPLIGSKEGIANLAFAWLDLRDVALVPDPAYPVYAASPTLAGANCFRVPLLAERDWLPDLEAIPDETLSRARLLWLNYPNNPTSATAPLHFFEQAIAFCRKHGILLAHDNPYCDLTYDSYIAPSILQIPGAREVAIEFNSLSKTYNMAGWRVGMAVGNSSALKALATVKTNIDSGIFRPIQDAAIAALKGDQSWITDRNSIYQERRDIVLQGLRAAGLKAATPRGTMYIWTRVPADYTANSFASKLLQETGVSVSPGTFFGERGEGYVRVSFCVDTGRLREVMARLQRLNL